ncbi:hypothetical protein DBR11_10690 [Pedobacter sp. HMWF019]|uniref:sensor histidine kinase n=1 Tax=Pedobacter sp. HMWF019 TaxID=2056856 RepID=UPI000D3BD631|nr:histidine kinase [Pedobacter sp. HMWF019]PTT00150.1 hypothetical protein DBR11_10690 [Pedobacter sp. HMWF019]
MKKTRIVFIHMLCWILILLYRYGAYLLNNNFTFSRAAFDVSMAIVQISQFYFCYLWVFPRFLKRKTIPMLLVGIILAIILFVALRYLTEEVIYLKLFNFHNYDSDTTAIHYFLDNSYYSISYIVLAGAAWGITNAFRTEKNNSLLKEEAKKAELAFLKSQINPHFLYNTLNYVYSLAIPVSDKLANAVLRLSALMRYTLNDNPDGKVKLLAELEYLESYIELFRMRFEPDFYVEFSTSKIEESQKIAALILIPFVENAFKHGVVNNAAHPVRIHIRVEQQMLTLEVSNLISHAQKDHSSGIGLVNIQRRLDLIYPEAYQLSINQKEQIYRTTLTIPVSLH